MKKRLFWTCLLLASAFGSRLPLQGQGTPQGEPRARMRLRENINNLYLLQLTRALELTEEQAAKIYPFLTRAEKEKAGIQQGMGQDLRDLRAELAEARPGEEKLRGLAARIREARRSLREKDDEVEAFLDGVLTPVQKARYYVFTVDFLRRIGENADRIRGKRPLIKRTP